jgi:hypothetical protein
MSSTVSAELVCRLATAEDVGASTRSGPAHARMRRLIEAQAWTDAALALVASELPRWKVRRLVYEDSVWLCSLTRHWTMPDWLGDYADARHESLPLAILAALSEAQRQDTPDAARASASVPRCPQSDPAAATPMCCDNFA